MASRRRRKTRTSEVATKKRRRKKKPGHARKRKAIANVTSLRAAIERLKAENSRLKSAKPKRRKCSCKKKKGTSAAMSHTHRKPKRAKMRNCTPVSKKRSSRRKTSYKSFIPSFLK